MATVSRAVPRATQYLTIARVLHARLYVNCAGRIFVVGGPPAFAPLARMLAQHRRAPTAAEAPTPAELGISTCDGELTDDLLHSIARALTRWSKELGCEGLRRPAKRRRRAQVTRERQEIDRLTARLALLRRWKTELAAGAEPAGAPLFLDADGEAELRAALVALRPAKALPPNLAWLARVVYWLSGTVALGRFLKITAAVGDAQPEVSRYDPLHGLRRAAIAWKQRAPLEKLHDLIAEMGVHIRRLPPLVAQQGQFTARYRNRTFVEHCDQIIAGCEGLLGDDAFRRRYDVPAMLAALAAADGSKIALPERRYAAWAAKEDLFYMQAGIQRLAEQIGRPGYDLLLAAVDALPKDYYRILYDDLRELLVEGHSAADAAWACRRNLLDFMRRSCLKLGEVRRLDELFTLRGCPLKPYELNHLVRAIRTPEDLTPVRAWLAWLGSVSASTFTPRMRQTLHATFLQVYLPSARHPGWFARLQPYLTALPRRKNAEDRCVLLARIAAYQQAVGHEETLPKSLRKLLDAGESRHRELEYLQSHAALGTLDPAAHARLARLEAEGPTSPDADKVRRVAEEVFLLLGLEALAGVVRRLAAQACRENLGELALQLEPDRLRKFAYWMGRMTDVERDRLRTVIAARARHGRGYKRYLAENQPWIGAAQAAGRELEPWFTAEPQRRVLNGRAVEIVVAGELHDIFLMGTYFDTCLAQGGCNEMSVLTNAYDANKQVVFMFTHDASGTRQVVARQLISVSTEFQLLGYCCYTNHALIDKEHHPAVLNAMGAYCGRLAGRCGFELVDEGAPAEIGNHFWYDDGTKPWPAVARALWNVYSRQPTGDSPRASGTAGRKEPVG